MKVRVQDDDGIQLSTLCRQLKLPSSDGKKYETDCVNTEDAFRIVQSIPSPKAEPFKRWLAKVGYERVQEIENPELATKRTRMLYKLKGYSEDWIEKRMRGKETMKLSYARLNGWSMSGASADLMDTSCPSCCWREKLEKEIGRSVVTKKNFLKSTEDKLRLRKKTP